MYYINIIKDAIYVCPIIALLIAGIYFCIQYKVYGSVSIFRTIVLYSFLLYCVAAYFLVIFPLPNPIEVALRTTPYYQLVPFNVVKVFFEDSGFVLTNPSTYISSLKSMEFLQPAFNFLLTLPLGCYLRYYFKCSTKMAWVISFVTTLFFELTQLSGLYGYYARPYRLFDVDDLILNTLGSMFGFFIVKFVMNILPSRDKIDSVAVERGRSVGGFRRIYAKLIDTGVVFFLWGIECIGVMTLLYSANEKIAGLESLRRAWILLNKDFKTEIVFYLFFVTYILYDVLFALLYKGNTIGKILTGIKVCDGEYNVPKRRALLKRIVIFYSIIFLIPHLIERILCILGNKNPIFYFVDWIMLFILLIYVFIKFNSKKENKKLLIHEKMSKTRVANYAIKARELAK